MSKNRNRFPVRSSGSGTGPSTAPVNPGVTAHSSPEGAPAEMSQDDEEQLEMFEDLPVQVPDFLAQSKETLEQPLAQENTLVQEGYLGGDSYYENLLKEQQMSLLWGDDYTRAREALGDFQ